MQLLSASRRRGEKHADTHTSTPGAPTQKQNQNNHGQQAPTRNPHTPTQKLKNTQKPETRTPSISNGVLKALGVLHVEHVRLGKHISNGVLKVRDPADFASLYILDTRISNGVLKVKHGVCNGPPIRRALHLQRSIESLASSTMKRFRSSHCISNGVLKEGARSYAAQVRRSGRISNGVLKVTIFLTILTPSGVLSHLQRSIESVNKSLLPGGGNWNGHLQRSIES